MSDNKILNVGFIGLNPDSHWAATAHLPALNALKDKFRIVGVANSTHESAKKTADALNLPFAFQSASDLVASSEIDVVVVTVKVPHHLELVSAALKAGKHVYCEWPLGNGLAEAEQLASLARDAGVITAIGTQAREAIEIAHVKYLIDTGVIGDVLSTSLIGSGGNWAGETIEDYYYLFDSANGATMQDIPMAHTLAAMQDVLGEFDNLEARFVSRFTEVKVTDTHAGDIRPKTAPDQVMLHGTLSGGTAVSVHYRGGVSKGTNLLWEINGTKGDIQITGDLGHAQIVQLSVKCAGEDDDALTLNMPDDSEYEGWPEMAAARNVARVYSKLHDDITTGSKTVPSFASAVKLHTLLDKIERSAKHAK